MKLSREELFTQSAHLQGAAFRPDSEVIETPELAYTRTRSLPERWANAVARALQPPARFGEIDALISRFDAEGVNFNWHFWPSSQHTELLPYLLTRKGMQRIAEGDFLVKPVSANTLKPGSSTDASSDEAPAELRGTARLLTARDIDAYVAGKMLGWGNPPEAHDHLRGAAERALADARNATWFIERDGRIVAAGSSYIDGELAYLKGDFVIPEYRGRGIYRDILLAREHFLAERGVRTLTVLANRETSSPAFHKLGYEKRGEIVVLARRRSNWVSV